MQTVRREIANGVIEGSCDERDDDGRLEGPAEDQAGGRGWSLRHHAVRGHGRCSAGKPANVISEEVNAELEANGAVLQPTTSLVDALRETRT